MEERSPVPEGAPEVLYPDPPLEAPTCWTSDATRANNDVCQSRRQSR